MKALHLTELAAHVVSWHNRHPLARRISVVHVHSMGVVVLPFVAPVTAVAAGAARAAPAGPAAPPTEQVAPDPAPGATLRERAMAKARQQAAAAPAAAASAAVVSPAAAPAGKLEPAFSEDLLPPLTPAQVAAWTLAHGAPLPAQALDAPVRQVKTDDGADTSRLTRLWVLTAQIDVGKRQVRLLIGAGAAAHVLGARLWSPRRLAAAAALAAVLAAALAAAGTAVLKRPARPDAAVAARTAGAASTAVATSATPSAPASAGSAAAARAVATAAASAVALPAGRPADVEATLGRVALPSLGPRIDRRRQAARLAAGESEPPAAPPPAPTPAAPPAPAVAVAAVAASAAAASAPVAAQPPSAPASKASNFALSTRLLRTRSESQQVAAALRAVLLTPQAPHMQVQVLRTGEDFRVLAWPYSQRALAEQMRTRLAARGLKVEVVDF